MYRKVEGEAKGEAHGEGHGTFDGTSVPLRRWEDWERSRLRKIKREERRRREMERAFPNGYASDDRLNVRNGVRSYDGSDTVSIASSEDDQWGPQIGGYNEHNPQYPAPPTGLFMPRNDFIASAETVGGADLEAMLESGFEDRTLRDNNSQSTTNLLSSNAARYQLSDAQPKPRFHAYSPVARSSSPGDPVPRHVMSPISPTIPTNGVSSAVSPEWQTHAKKRSGGRGGGGGDYGPLGPLDPGAGSRL